MAAISEADNAMMMRAKHGFWLKMVINFDSDVAKQAFFLVRIIAAQLRLPDALVNTCELLSGFFCNSVSIWYTKPFVCMFCLAAV